MKKLLKITDSQPENQQFGYKAHNDVSDKPWYSSQIRPKLSQCRQRKLIRLGRCPGLPVLAGHNTGSGTVYVRFVRSEN